MIVFALALRPPSDKSHRRARDMLARLVNVYLVLADACNCIHRDQELRLAEAEKAAGRDFEKPHLLFALINEQIVCLADLLTIPVEYFSSADVLRRVRED